MKKLFVSMMSMIMMALSLITPVSAFELSSNHWYYIATSNDVNYVLDVSNGSKDNGARIQLFRINYSDAQLWRFESKDGKYCQIINKGSGKVMDVKNNGTANGTILWQFERNGTNAQNFKIMGKKGSRIVSFKAYCGKYIDLSGNNVANGTSINIWEGNNTKAQKFYLIDAGEIKSNQGSTYYVSTTAGLNLRSSQSTSSRIIAAMPYRSQVTVYSVSNGWAYLEYNGYTGYASAQYLSKSQPAANQTNSWDSYVGKTVANINSYYYTSGNMSYNGGYKGQCTWYAYGRFYEVNGIALKTALHARYWLTQNANDSRVAVVSNIQSKSIAVRTSGSYGHVMFIEHVSYVNGSPAYVYFTECNNDGNGQYDAGTDCIVKKMSYSQFVSTKKPAGYIMKR